MCFVVDVCSDDVSCRCRQSLCSRSTPERSRVKRKLPQQQQHQSLSGTNQSESPILLSDVDDDDDAVAGRRAVRRTVESSDSGDEAVAAVAKSAGLIDGLSKFFTPGERRTSRVALLSRTERILPLFVRHRPNDERNRSSTSNSRKTKSQTAASRLLKKSKQRLQSKNSTTQHHRQKSSLEKHSQSKRVATKLRRPKTKRNVLNSNQAGVSGHVTSLYDGLSNFFTAKGERKKALPMYSLYFKRVPKLEKNAASTNAAVEKHAPADDVKNEDGAKARRSVSPAKKRDRALSPSVRGTVGSGILTAAARKQRPDFAKLEQQEEEKQQKQTPRSSKELT